ncbi:MAG: methyltransferase [Candidatus Micrarchaeota archaeon]|nr:methyltransferase [Candidatus Micrarchaeota archaeon]
MYKEGKAAIRYKRGSFLNPEGLVSRDISCALAATISTRKTRILDSTSATGIRGIRYYLETPSKDVTFLEMNRAAFSSMKRNVGFNKVKAKMHPKSIQEFANTERDKFDIIDLDPFGGVTPYIYDLMKISRSGTHMFITATDTAVLCGADYGACLRLYDARPMHNEMCKEVGIRILAGYVARVAAQFSYGVEVVAAFSYLHYMRIFVRLRHGSGAAAASLKNMGYVHYCGKCLNRSLEHSVLPKSNTCGICGSQMDGAGKAWLGSMSDKKAVKAIMEEIARNPGLYSDGSMRLIEELSKEVDTPTCYSIPAITKKMGIGSIGTKPLMELLDSRGFQVSRTHLSSYSIKTGAGIEEVKSAIRALSKNI